MQPKKDFTSNSNHKDSPSLSTNQNAPLNDKEAKFTYFRSPIKNTKPYKDITLSDVVKVIRGEGKAKDATATLRAIDNVDRARGYKGANFDYVTFSGTFSKREKASLKAYSGLLVLDFDDVDIDLTKRKLLNQTDFDVALLFVSPSGNGIKAVVPSTTTPNEHEQTFRMYQRYCKEELGLEVDESGKDVARACFICWDELAVYNQNYNYRKLDKYCNEPHAALPTHQPTCAQSKSNSVPFDGPSPFDEYNQSNDFMVLLEAHGWRRCESHSDRIRFTRPGKRSGISADFEFSKRVLYIFSDKTDFKASQGYTPSQVFSTLECGGNYKEAYKKLLDMGYGKKPARFSSNNNLPKTDGDNNKRDFYSISDGKVALDISQMVKLFKELGFMRISEEGNDAINIIRNRRKILKPFNYKTETIALLTQHINHPKHKAKIKELLIKRRLDVDHSWKLMKGQPYNLHSDTKDTIYLPFKNGVCKITKDGMEMVDYKCKEIGFFIDNIESQNHHFTPFDMDKRAIGDFEKFLIYAIIGRETDELTPKEWNDVRAFYSMIGYLISNHKDPANAFGIIFTDEGTSGDNRKGGRGKSLLAEALKMVRCSIFRDGAKFNPTYAHVYGDLEEYHDLYIMDELSTKLDLYKLFADITGDIRAERKGSTAVTVPFKDTPKFVFTTNQILRYNADEDSFNRRFVEYKFSNYWNFDHRPATHFGHNFFDGWDSDQWQLFFEFLVACCMRFLITGLERINYSKDEDNYWSYFSDDLVVEEFKRVLEIMGKNDNFGVMDFLGVHRTNAVFKYKPVFHKKNTRDSIQAYIKKHNLAIEYNETSKKWTFQENENE